MQGTLSIFCRLLGLFRYCTNHNLYVCYGNREILIKLYFLIRYYEQGVYVATGISIEYNGIRFNMDHACVCWLVLIDYRINRRH